MNEPLASMPVHRDTNTRESDSATTGTTLCLMGAHAVGKSALVSRYRHGIFPEHYRATVEVATELTPEIVEDASRRLVQAVEGKTLAELEQAQEQRLALLRERPGRVRAGVCDLRAHARVHHGPWPSGCVFTFTMGFMR